MDITSRLQSFLEANNSEENNKNNLERCKSLVDKSIEGDYDGVKSLLECGTSVNAAEYVRYLFYQSKNYATPVAMAAKAGHHQVVQLLIDFDAKLEEADRFDVTAVHHAAQNGHVKCLRKLLENDAQCNVPTKYSKYGSYTVPYVGGTTPLHLAARENHVDCIKELIMNGADYNAVDQFGRTSLYIAAELGYEEAVLTHLRNALSRDILSLPVKDTGETPLHKCIAHGHLKAVEELLKHGSDPNHMNSQGLSPLHLALQNSVKFSRDIVTAIVTLGARVDVNLPDGNGFTPLHYVCFKDRPSQFRQADTAALLIAHAADFTCVRSKHGASILQQELQTVITDMTILKAIVKTLPALPSLEQIFGADTPRHNQKIKWYLDIAHKPRSLQHYCRCVVRTCIGCVDLRQVYDMVLPNELKDYLMLHYDEYR